MSHQDPAYGAGSLSHARSPLNGPQRRALGATLGHTLDVLDTIERLARLSEGESPRWSGALDEQRRAAVLTAVAIARAGVLHALSHLHLSAMPQDIAAAIRGEAAILWSDLVEITPQHLRGYGPLTPAATEALEQQVPDLLQIVQEIGRILAADPPTGTDGL
jgi:hypothetical protein